MRQPFTDAIGLAQGGTVADACRRIGVTEPRYDRWRK
jgi:putative transposase